MTAPVLVYDAYVSRFASQPDRRKAFERHFVPTLDAVYANPFRGVRVGTVTAATVPGCAGVFVLDAEPDEAVCPVMNDPLSWLPPLRRAGEDARAGLEIGLDIPAFLEAHPWIDAFCIDAAARLECMRRYGDVALLDEACRLNPRQLEVVGERHPEAVAAYRSALEAGDPEAGLGGIVDVLRAERLERPAPRLALALEDTAAARGVLASMGSAALRARLARRPA